MAKESTIETELQKERSGEKEKTIDLAISSIEKQFGKGSIMRLGSDSPIPQLEVISSGSIGLDAALGVGGFPKGRVIEIYGPESSGKTTLALHVIAETHKLTQDILLERDVPDGPDNAGLPALEISDKELTKNIIIYLQQMTDGDLESAQKTADSIAPYGPQAVKVLDRIALSEMPEPELADIPPQVLSGLIRNLRTKIS